MIYSETKPPDEYGEWVVEEDGRVIRTVVRWTECITKQPGEPKSWIPVVDFEVKECLSVPHVVNLGRLLRK